MKTDRNILVAFIINLVFSVVEFLGGLVTNSAAVLSDSIHDLSDTFSVGLSYFLERKSKKSADKHYTYGYVRYSVLGSFIAALILIVSSALIIAHAVGHIVEPEDVNYSGMIILAIIGVIMKTVAVFITHGKGSLNQKTVNLHMLADTLSWAIVLIGAIVMRFTGIRIIDPIMSVGVALFILVNAAKNMRSAIDIFLEKTPEGIDIKKVKKALLKIDGVNGVHHIHVRSIDGYHNCATMHIAAAECSHELKNAIRHELAHQNIEHVTLEFELGDEDCGEQKCELATCTIRHKHTHCH